MDVSEKSKPKIPSGMANLFALRMQALELVGSETDTVLTLREELTVGTILRRNAGLQPELFADIGRDMSEYKIPRFTMLVGMLAPYGLMLKFPAAMIAVSKYLLGTTREQEEAKVNWDWMRKLYPDRGL